MLVGIFFIKERLVVYLDYSFVNGHFEMVERKNKEITAKIVVGIYTFGNWVFYQFKIPVIKPILYFVYKILNFVFVKILFNTEIPAEAKFGKGLVINHPYGIIINPHVTIGKNATLRHQVTIGNKGGTKNDGVPHIGNNLNVGAGAKIIGPINIGDNVTIGTNAVVTKNFGNHLVLVGVPAKIIKAL